MKKSRVQKRNVKVRLFSAELKKGEGKTCHATTM
jgi:hypothetical protein